MLAFLSARLSSQSAAMQTATTAMERPSSSGRLTRRLPRLGGGPAGGWMHLELQVAERIVGGRRQRLPQRWPLELPVAGPRRGLAHERLVAVDRSAEHDAQGAAATRQPGAGGGR